jgi:AraC-like DNA-binding protein/quercetin dioxygenase-like cupin family protein
MSRKRHTPGDEPHFLVRTVAASLPNGHELPAHSHSWGQLIYVAAGVISVWTEQGSWVAPPHWAIWAPAGVAHAIRITGTASLCMLYVRPGLEGLAATSAVVMVSALLRELILRAVEIGMLDDREPSHAAMADLIVHELRSHPTAALDLPLPRSGRLRRIAEHVAQSPGERTRQAALARRFGIGTRTLERGFLAETGLSFARWRRQARFLHALRCLGGGAPVKHAALESGYQSPSAFIAAFRAALHTTPGRYLVSREEDTIHKARSTPRAEG